MSSNSNEYTIELLAAMVATNIAKRQKISKTKAFSRFMKSKTAEMLFDESTYMWMNGPDYIADEYEPPLPCGAIAPMKVVSRGFSPLQTF